MGEDLYAPNDFSQFPRLRQVLAPQYAILPANHIRGLMNANFGPNSAEAYDQYLEFGFSDIGKAFKSAANDVGKAVTSAAPVAATIGGGALKGALAGAQYGPAGILAGAAIGGAGAGLSKYGGGAAKTVGGVLSNVTGVASHLSPLGRVGSAAEPFLSGLAGGGKGGAAGAAVNALGSLVGAATGGSSALRGIGGLLGGPAGQALSGALSSGQPAGAVGGLLSGMFGRSSNGPAGALTNLFGGTRAIDQLMSLSGRPEMGMALGALGLGKLGRPTIPVGASQAPVPTAALAGLFSQLADQVVSEAADIAGDAEGEMSYMLGENGEYLGDPAFGRDRAARIWDLLNEAQADRLIGFLADALPSEAEQSESEFEMAERAEAYGDALDEEYYDALDRAELFEYESEAMDEFVDEETYDV